MKLKSWKVFAILFEIFLGISASTHWVVTENGRIQSQLDSAFHLRRPYDLLALLEQERMVRSIETLYRDMMEHKVAIDQQWSAQEGATDLESRLYSQDVDCLRAGRPLSDTDLYNSVAGNLEDRIRLAHYLPLNFPVSGPDVPDCKETGILDFSMHTFEHLNAMVIRSNLSSNPESDLSLLVLSEYGMAQFAQQVAAGLERNTTSWLHHNLAAIYWRVHGDISRAIECARKAVYYSPRHHRDLALLNLGSIFHQAHFPTDAAIVLHAAVDHAPNMAASHYILGNVYAVLGDYNRSVACYDNAVKLRPDWDQVVRIKHSVLCHRKLEKGLLDLHESLQNILAELHDYHHKQGEWLKHQEKLIREQAPLELRLLGQEHSTFSSLLGNRGQSCVQHIQDGRPVLSCDVNKQLLAHRLQIDITPRLQILLSNVESQAKVISEEMTRRSHIMRENLHATGGSERLRVEEPAQQGKDPIYHKPTRPPNYPLSVGTSGAEPPEYDREGWPSREECTAFAGSFPTLQHFPSVVLPPENKGFEVHLYLSELIELGPEDEHALPWYPPLCSAANPTSNSLVRQYLPATTPREPELPGEESLRPQLLRYVEQGRGVEAEIGQRILTAINKVPLYQIV